MLVFKSIQNLYRAEDLPGENLVQPLKIYQRLFSKPASGMQKLIIRVGQIASGVLLYPVFGFVAGIGMLIKVTGLSGVESKNEEAKSHVKVIKTGIQACRAFDDDYATSKQGNHWHAINVREFTVTKQNADTLCPSIQKQIDQLTKQFQKVYLQSKGHIENGQGEIRVILQVYRRDSNPIIF